MIQDAVFMMQLKQVSGPVSWSGDGVVTRDAVGRKGGKTTCQRRCLVYLEAGGGGNLEVDSFWDGRPVQIL